MNNMAHIRMVGRILIIPLLLTAALLITVPRVGHGACNGPEGEQVDFDFNTSQGAQNNSMHLKNATTTFMAQVDPGYTPEWAAPGASTTSGSGTSFSTDWSTKGEKSVSLHPCALSWCLNCVKSVAVHIFDAASGKLEDAIDAIASITLSDILDNVADQGASRVVSELKNEVDDAYLNNLISSAQRDDYKDFYDNKKGDVQSFLRTNFLDPIFDTTFTGDNTNIETDGSYVQYDSDTYSAGALELDLLNHDFDVTLALEKIRDHGSASDIFELLRWNPSVAFSVSSSVKIQGNLTIDFGYDGLITGCQVGLSKFW